MASTLSGRRALITGATGGLAAPVARRLAEEGVHLALIARRPEPLAALRADLARRSGGPVLAEAVDVADAPALAAAVVRLAEALGGLDILINAAGINRRYPAETFPLDEFETVLRVNLVGTFVACQAAIPYLKRSPAGRIVNFGSMLGQIALPERAAYAASKGAVHQLTRVLALELAPWRVTVNALAPGPYLTPMNTAIAEDPGKREGFVARIPLGRFGDPEGLAEFVRYLVSDDAGFVTGSVLTVDGGWTAQ